MARVLLIHEDTREPGQGGGAESLLRDTARSLRMHGHEVAWLQDGKIAWALAHFKPDVCQVMTIHNHLGFGPAQHLQEWHIPHVWALMDYWPFCGNRNLLSGTDTGCSAVKGVCDSVCREGRSPSEWQEIVNRSPVVMLNGYTAEIFRRHGLRSDYTVEPGVDTAMFGLGEKQTGSIYTSSAWPRHPVKGMHVLKQAIRGSAVEVHLITGLPRERVAEALSTADIYVFPSVYEETFGLGLCEAMASGCACIASDVAGARAQLHAGLGLLVPPRDATALRAAIDYLRSNPDEARAMGERARAHVEQEHSLEAMGRRWEAVYEKVLGRVAV